MDSCVAARTTPPSRLTKTIVRGMEISSRHGPIDVEAVLTATTTH
jgi:hypothetical protein